MIRWCAYCQRFMGESPPYGDYGLTHDVCDDCLPLFESDNDHGFERITELERFHDALREAGETEGLDQAMALIEETRSLGVRPSDLLVELIAWALAEPDPNAQLGPIMGESAIVAGGLCDRSG